MTLKFKNPYYSSGYTPIKKTFEKKFVSSGIKSLEKRDKQNMKARMSQAKHAGMKDLSPDNYSTGVAIVKMIRDDKKKRKHRKRRYLF